MLLFSSECKVSNCVVVKVSQYDTRNVSSPEWNIPQSHPKGTHDVCKGECFALGGILDRNNLYCQMVVLRRDSVTRVVQNLFIYIEEWWRWWDISHNASRTGQRREVVRMCVLTQREST